MYTIDVMIAVGLLRNGLYCRSSSTYSMLIWPDFFHGFYYHLFLYSSSGVVFLAFGSAASRDSKVTSWYDDKRYNCFFTERCDMS